MTTAVVTILLLALLSHFQDRWTRPWLFFAVTVDPAFRGTVEARQILYRYRMIVWISAALATILYVATGATAALLIQLAGLTWALADAHSRTRAWTATQPAIREVDLRAPSETLPGGPVAALLPEASIVAVAIWTAAHWGRLPTRIPIRWRTGQPQWISRTPAGVYGFLGVEMVTCLSLLLCAWGILHWSRRVSTADAGATSDRRIRRLTVRFFLAIPWLVAVHAGLTLLLPLDNGAFIFLSVVTIAIMAGFLWAILFTATHAARVTSGSATARSDGTPDSCWKLGEIYFNPADSSIFVARRFGFGYTLNMGNRWSWVVLAVVLGGAVLKRILK